MGAVEAGEHVEAGAEQVGLEREAFAHEMDELVDLAGQEVHSEQRRGEPATPATAAVPRLHRGQRQHHVRLLIEQHEGAVGGERDVEDSCGRGPTMSRPW